MYKLIQSASHSNTAISILLFPRFPSCNIVPPCRRHRGFGENRGKCRMTKGRTRVAMRDCTEMFNESGEHIATIAFNESYGLWQIVFVQRKEMGFFCPS